MKRLFSKRHSKWAWVGMLSLVGEGVQAALPAVQAHIPPGVFAVLSVLAFVAAGMAKLADPKDEK